MNGQATVVTADGQHLGTLNQVALTQAANDKAAAVEVVGDCLRLRDDLDRNADRETKIAVSAPLINSDFGEPVRILVPEGRARRPIAEGPLALQQLTRRDELSVGRQRGRPQPSHGIAEMVDVNDFAEIVRPICPTIRVILARPAGWRLAA